MTIVVKDNNGETAYDVEETSLGFRASKFPPPAFGRKYFLADTEIEVTEHLPLAVVDGVAMFDYSYRIVRE